MGRQHGRQVQALRSQIEQAIAIRFSQLEQEGAEAAFETLVEQTQHLLQQVDPSTIDLIRGLAHGLELPFDRLLRYNLAAFLRDVLTTRRAAAQDTEGCTTWAAAGPATADGLPILVKNRDYNLEHLPLQRVARAVPAHGYRYTFITSAGSPGVFVGGINEAGLAVADTHVPSPDVGPGLPTYALSMHLLEEHSSVRSALAYLQSVPRLGRNNLLLADAGGDIALFEIGHTQFGIVEASKGILINTNHYQTAAMQPHFVDTDPPALRGNTLARYRTVQTALAGAYGQISPALAQQVQASHAGPLASICRHPHAEAKTSTIAALIFLPVQRQLLFCHGQPCTGDYREFNYA
jgi:predicted choloylglycine hydrolase